MLRVEDVIGAGFASTSFQGRGVARPSDLLQTIRSERLSYQETSFLKEGV